MNDIKDALDRVADAGGTTPHTLETVRGRARRLRRRRTTTAVVASAAAVATVAGLGVALGPSGSGDGSRPPIARTPTAPPSPTSPASPTRAAGADAVGPVHAVTLDVGAEGTSGGEPQVPYWAGGRIVDTDGSSTPLAERPLAFAWEASSRSWVVVRAGEAHAELVRLRRDGDVLDGPRPTFEHGLAVDPGGRMAVIEQDADGWALRVGDDRVALGRSVEDAQVDGFLADGDVVVGVDGRTQVADAFSGALSDLPGAVTAVAAPTLPFTAVGREDGTWAAQRPDGAAQWSLDWAGVSSFSPDGRYVALAGDPRHRIAGSQDWDSEHATGTLWIRTAADLVPVAAFTAPAGGYFWSWAWEGDQLLATVYLRDTGRWSLVRLAAGGPTILRGTSVAGGGEEPAYVFGSR